MFSKQFLNVQEHFLKCSANILKSAKKNQNILAFIQNTMIYSWTNFEFVL